MNEFKRQWSKLNVNIKTLIAVVVILIVAGGIASLARGQSAVSQQMQPYCEQLAEAVGATDYVEYFGFLRHDGSWEITQAYKGSLEHVFGEYQEIRDTTYNNLGIIQFENMELLAFFD